MCDNCSENINEIDEMDLDAHQIAGMALAMLGVLIESYCDEGYCDPTMYKALVVAEKFADKLGEPALTTRLATAKMFAGEVVNEMIDKHEMNIDKGAWA